MSNRRVIRSFPIPGTLERVVLFAWSYNPEPRKHNIARIDRQGAVVWQAELPCKALADCFNSLQRDGDGFVARTYSEWVVYLNADGVVSEAKREPALA